MFDMVKNLLTFLLVDNLAQQVAEQMNIIAEGVICFWLG